MKAEILAVGTELLLGDIVNSNAQYLSRRLADLGIAVYHHSVVGDNVERLKESYELAFSRADIVIATGGLGPTKDDLTKEVAAEYFSKELVLHNESLERIEGFFKRMNRQISEGNRKQAYIPEGSKVLPNDNGTAPGCIIENQGKTLVLLPGPPREMSLMFESYVRPFLEKLQSGVLISKVIRVVGLGESAMAEQVEDIIDSQTNPTIAPYAKDGESILRITARGKDAAEAEALIEPVERQISERLGENIYGIGDTNLESVLGEILTSRNLTIAVAESCTGGLLAGRLINYPGISSVFMEGMVTYSNEAKIKRLGVNPKTLESFGAVSRETAYEMAKGIADAAGTSIGMSVTGIAGPGGGTLEKPVGLVYLGLSLNGEVKTKELNLSGDRQRIRERTVISALDWLRREIISKK